MVWSIHRQQQQCGVQMPPRADGDRQLGEGPAEEVDGPGVRGRVDRGGRAHEQVGMAISVEIAAPCE